MKFDSNRCGIGSNLGEVNFQMCVLMQSNQLEVLISGNRDEHIKMKFASEVYSANICNGPVII